MDPGETRLQRVLARHRDAALVEHRSGRHTVIRRDQVLADPRDTEVLDSSLARWTRAREDVAGAARYHLRPEAGIDVGELVSDLRGDGNAGYLSLSPNHLIRGEPGWFMGPASVPAPAREVPAPPAPAAEHPTTVAVLDTGISAHPWFDDRDWYSPQHQASVAEVLDANLDHELDSQAGHGTFIAGVVLQHAPAAHLEIRRVLGSDGICDELDLVRALHDLRQHRDQGGSVDIVNLSLGCYTFDDEPTPVVQRVIESFGTETVFVCCAGNDASDRPFWPGALESALAVAALGAHGEERAAFSNYGQWVDACAVGEDLCSSFVHFDGAAPAIHRADPDDFDGYARWSGTSFAAPAVAGEIAARREAAGTTAAEAAATLLDPSSTQCLPGLGAVVRS